MPRLTFSTSIRSLCPSARVVRTRRGLVPGLLWILEGGREPAVKATETDTAYSQCHRSSLQQAQHDTTALHYQGKKGNNNQTKKSRPVNAVLLGAGGELPAPAALATGVPLGSSRPSSSHSASACLASQTREKHHLKLETCQALTQHTRTCRPTSAQRRAAKLRSLGTKGLSAVTW